MRITYKACRKLIPEGYNRESTESFNVGVEVLR